MQCGLLAGQSSAAFFQIKQCYFSFTCITFAADAYKDMFDVKAAMLLARCVQLGQVEGDFFQQLLV
jgi:hypothetical protein